jgi:hypothetical protein
MAIVYDIYKGNSSGGQPDYSASPYASGITALTWTDSAALADNTETVYGVRARDTVSGLNDGNTDAQVTIPVGASGQDLGGLPYAPAGLSATPGSGGTALVQWVYAATNRDNLPTGFHVYFWQSGDSPNYTTPAETVAYGLSGLPFALNVPGTPTYSASLAGLSDGVSYVVAVRAYNAAGIEQNTNTVTVVGNNHYPLNVACLTGTASS